MKTKETKRKEAEARQRAHDMLSVKEKLDGLSRGNLTATKEKAKLSNVLASRVEVKIATKKEKPKKANGRSSKAITKKELKAAKKATKNS